MPDPVGLVDRLKQFQSLAGVPESELNWIASQGSVRRLKPAQVLVAHAAEATEGLFVVLSGTIVMHLVRGGERRLAAEWPPGDLIGLLPYSRMKTPPGDVVAREPSEVLVIHRNLFPAMIRECHEITSRLVHVMIDRARVFTSTDLHDEKLAALGRMAAGLAHELNNPASAVVRGARSLVEKFADAEEASRALGTAGLDADQMAAVDRLNLLCADRAADLRTPIEQADFEDAIIDWLDHHRASVDHAEALAETNLDLAILDELAGVIDPRALDAALRWVAAVSSGRNLANEVEQAASSIYDLVRAVQGFTSMDRALVAEAIDVGRGLSTTVLVLKSKAREKSVGISLVVEEDLPEVIALAGELNQVWVNLIANAIDAVAEGGQIRVRASYERNSVVVRVIDDGHGIPEATRQHIFEPFFTTKEVGDGMGLGLDIVRRLVQRNDGEIEVESQPGHTEFRVSLRGLTG